MSGRLTGSSDSEPSRASELSPLKCAAGERSACCAVDRANCRRRGGKAAIKPLLDLGSSHQGSDRIKKCQFGTV